MMLILARNEDAGNSMWIPLPEHLTGLYADEQSDVDETYRLLKQNVIRRVVETVPWDRTTDPLPPDTWEVINYVIETINGDVYAESPHSAFVPTPPGAYNLKTLFELDLTIPAANTVYKMIRVDTAYRKLNSSGSIGAWISLASAIANYLPGNMWGRLASVSIAGADTVVCDAGEWLQFGWRYKIDVDGEQIHYYDRFYARFVAERVKDEYNTNTGCCT